MENGKNTTLIDYSTVTDKKILIDRIQALQESIQQKQETLEKESNMRVEFQALIQQKNDQKEPNQKAAA